MVRSIFDTNGIPYYDRLRRHSKYASAEISFVGFSLRWYLGRAMGKYSVSTGNCTISSFLNSLINNQEKTKVVEQWCSVP